MTNQVIKEITITRTFDAPRELVFKVWTEANHLKEWWSPRGFTNPVCEIDARPGGKIRICMDHPQFPNHWMGGEVLEINPPEKLVFTTRAFEDKDGNWGLHGKNIVTFEDVDGKTKLTVKASLTKLKPELQGAADGMDQGWRESIDKLEEYIATIN